MIYYDNTISPSSPCHTASEELSYMLKECVVVEIRSENHQITSFYWVFRGFEGIYLLEYWL